MGSSGAKRTQAGGRGVKRVVVEVTEGAIESDMIRGVGGLGRLRRGCLAGYLAYYRRLNDKLLWAVGCAAGMWCCSSREYLDVLIRSSQFLLNVYNPTDNETA